MQDLLLKRVSLLLAMTCRTFWIPDNDVCCGLRSFHAVLSASSKETFPKQAYPSIHPSIQSFIRTYPDPSLSVLQKKTK